MTTDPNTALTSAVYNALRDFQQTADWPQLRLAQMRQHLAEHIVRDVSLTPGALPPAPAATARITVRELAHAIDNSTPYPVELDSALCRFMAERLLEMLTITKRAEHPVWQPEQEMPAGPQPQPEDPASLYDPEPTASAGLGVSATPSHTDQATVLLSEAERLMLRHALDLADANISARPDEYTAADEAALASLRRLAAEAQQQPDDTAEHHTVDGTRYLCHTDDHYCPGQPAAPVPEPSVHGESVAHLAGLPDTEPAADARQDEAQDRG